MVGDFVGDVTSEFDSFSDIYLIRVLLDEINLASSDTLQRLCGLLDDPSGSVTLTERGDASEIPRHPNFRLFAAMNPATDAGKKDLPESIRARFSELYVNELLDPVELRSVTARYLDSVLPVDGKPPEHKDVVISVVEVYLKCRQMADTVLSDGAGHKPRYTLRTLSRALSAAKSMVLEQRIALARALYEGFQLAFEGALDAASVEAIKKALKVLLPAEIKKSDLEHPGRRPGGSAGSAHVLIKPFWIKTGPKELVDWSEASSNGKSRFILTPSVSTSLRRLARALASGPWPILLEGPTSAGKTTLVEYIAARSGYHVVRINNHEHTDVQEYTGSFAADQNGSLTFRDGLLVQALRRGHWVILDELNLAPTDVLEALNRLLDDNRELYLAETNEVVKPHPDFRLFATQNPSSGAYGGRKPLSRAFRNRFVEIHMGDIPSAEMTTILEKRCGCPPSTATKLVEVMVALRYQRSKCNLFMGKDSFITPRDLLRWAERKSSSRLEFAEQGYMLLAERLRSLEEKEMVKSVLEEYLKVKLNPSEMYYGETSEALRVLRDALRNPELVKDTVVASIAPTRSLLRLITLVMTCIEQKEPVLLVGGKSSLR
jgi:midasin